MNKKLEKIKSFRLFVLKEISSLTSEQLNLIPEGYSNNIIWNLGHLVSASQAICYKRAGLAVTIDDNYFTPFLPATKPGNFINSEEIEIIKDKNLVLVKGSVPGVEGTLVIIRPSIKKWNAKFQ